MRCDLDRGELDVLSARRARAEPMSETRWMYYLSIFDTTIPLRDDVPSVVASISLASGGLFAH